MERYDALKNTHIYLPEKNPPPNPIKLTKHYQDLYNQVLDCHRIHHSTEREENILLLNSHQEWLIQQSYQSRIVPSIHDFSRKLIAYYRPTQINASARAEIQEIMRFLRYFIDSGYSPVFDEFGVVYRFPDTDILEEFREHSYLVSWYDFRALGNIYAHTIHFSNGTPEKIPWSVSIVGTTPFKRHGKNPHTIHLPLEYAIVDPLAGRHHPRDHIKEHSWVHVPPLKTLPTTLSTVIRTIQEMEQLLLDTIRVHK